MHLALKVAKDSLTQQVYAGGSRFPTIPLANDFAQDGGNELNDSWWMESVRCDSVLAPTSEVFELRVSERRGWGWLCVCVCVSDDEDETM